MNKEKAIQELDELENRVKELRRLIDGSGFDWDFNDEDWASIKTKSSRFKAYKMCRWIVVLQHLADHFNPDGWEWESGNRYSFITFDQQNNELSDDYWFTTETMAPKFHPDVIGDVIIELNNNKSKWWHLVTDSKLK